MKILVIDGKVESAPTRKDLSAGGGVMLPYLDNPPKINTAYQTVTEGEP